MNTWGKLGLLVGGIAIGHYGLKVLGSKPMKKAYAGVTAAALRAKDEIVKDATRIAEECADIAHEGQAINERWQAAEADAKLEEARALIENTAAPEEPAEA